MQIGTVLQGSREQAARAELDGRAFTRDYGQMPLRAKWIRNPVLLGLFLGVGFGLWNLIATRMAPLAEDTPAALLMFYGPMFAFWGLAGFDVSRRSGRLLDAVKVGVTVACVTFVVFDLAAIVRVNLFLDSISQRSDWQNLMAQFQASEFESLRAYANYVYVTGAPFKILAASVIGAVTGLTGGALGVLGHRESARI